MSAPHIAFFNNKGGVGKTSLVYHLSWMYAKMGLSVLAADLDPQANLTAAFLDEERLLELWPQSDHHPDTIYGCIAPLLIRGSGDIVSQPHVEQIDDLLHLIVGDLALARCEDELSQQWPHCLDGKERAFRVLSAFYRLIHRAAEQHSAEVVLIDVGPNLGALNRAALLAADWVVVPLSPDLFSLQGLRNLGPTLQTWRGEWQERLKKWPVTAQDLEQPAGQMALAGYVVQQHSVRLDRPVRAYEHWIEQIPVEYARSVRGQPGFAATLVDQKRRRQAKQENRTSTTLDPHCLALLKHYHSLMPLSQQVRKPMFMLKPADGAIGAQQEAVQGAYRDFEALAQRVGIKAGFLTE